MNYESAHIIGQTTLDGLMVTANGYGPAPWAQKRGKDEKEE